MLKSCLVLGCDSELVLVNLKWLFSGYANWEDFDGFILYIWSELYGKRGFKVFSFNDTNSWYKITNYYSHILLIF